LLDLFGAGNVTVELVAGGGGLADELHDALAQGARLVRESQGLDAVSLPLVATTNAHYARPADKRLADTHAALRAGVPLAEADPHLSSRPAHLRSGEEMTQLPPRYAPAVARAAQLGRDCPLDRAPRDPDLP